MPAASVTVDISGAGPWRHLTFEVDAAGAHSSHGDAASPASLDGLSLYLALSIQDNPSGAPLKVRYDSVTVR